MTRIFHTKFLGENTMEEKRQMNCQSQNKCLNEVADLALKYYIKVKTWNNSYQYSCKDQYNVYLKR